MAEQPVYQARAAHGPGRRRASRMPVGRLGICLLIAFLGLCLGSAGVPLAAVPLAGAAATEGDARPSESWTAYPQTGAQQDTEFVIVRQRNKRFDPPVVVIHEGDTVLWVNETAGGWHDVQSFEGEFSSERMDFGDTFVRTFDEAGVFGYYCTPHVVDGMQGAVVVLPQDRPLPDPLPTPALPAPDSPPTPDVQAEDGPPDAIGTVAGGGGNGGLATEASLYLPEGVAVDDDGAVYVSDTENCQVRRIDPGGRAVGVLGHASCGFSMGGDADLGTWQHTNYPRGVAVGPDGLLYVADTINCRVRRIEAAGTVMTIAGRGSCRASGDGGPAVHAGLSPWGLGWDEQGNLYIADVFNCRIRRLDSEGTITTVAGNGDCGFSGDGGTATAASLFFPRDVAVGRDGAIFIADAENCRVRRIDPATGVIETVAGATVAGGESCDDGGDGEAAEAASLQPWALAAEPGGAVLVADRAHCRVRRFVPGGIIETVAGTGRCGYSGDGGDAIDAALRQPSDIALAPDGVLYVADTGNCRIRRIETSGTITTIAGGGACAPGGDGGWAVSASAWHPMGLAMGEGGEWYFSELDTCRVRRVDANGIISTYAGNGLCGYAGDGGAAVDARLSDMLGGLALAEDGTLYIAEGYNCRVRSVTTRGLIHTVAGNGRCEFSGDGGPAREAALNFVADVEPDGSGGLLIAEPFNCRVRRVDLATGIIDTVVGDGSCHFNGEGVPAGQAGVEPWAVAAGPDGSIFLADSGNCRVRSVNADGLIATVAGGDECGIGGDGGPALQAQFLLPYDLALDQAGNLYVADLRAFTVRKVDAQGVISTVAGIGISRPIDIGGYDPLNGLLCSIHALPVPVPSYLGDGGPAKEAGLYFPYGIALDTEGHLYIADTFDHRVRRVACGGVVPCADSAALVDTPSDASDDETPPVALPETGQAAQQPYGGVSLAGLAALLSASLVLLAALVGLRRRGASRKRPY